MKHLRGYMPSRSADMTSLATVVVELHTPLPVSLHGVVRYIDFVEDITEIIFGAEI